MGKGVNLGGGFNRKETPLSQLPEKPLALNAKFFRDVVRRIETIVPTEDPNQDKDAIIRIIVSSPKGGSPGLNISVEENLNVITLNVCSNGAPAEIAVIGKKTAGESQT